MKKKCCYIEYDKERALSVYHTCLEIMKQVRHINIVEIFHAASKCPSPRFWVSEERAIYVLRKMLFNNDRLLYMHPSKRNMFYAILYACVRIRKEYGYTLNNSIRLAIYEEAPSYFLSPNSIKTIYYHYKNGKQPIF